MEKFIIPATVFIIRVFKKLDCNYALFVSSICSKT